MPSSENTRIIQKKIKTPCLPPPLLIFYYLGEEKKYYFFKVDFQNLQFYTFLYLMISNNFKWQILQNFFFVV